MNLFKQFIDLLPKTPLLVGDVVAITNGVATIEQPGGGRSQARGDAQVGDRVFFRNGAIEGAAPNLPIVLIDV